MRARNVASPPPHPSTEWVRLHDRFYRRHQLYPLDWKIILSEYITAVAPNGGPIAMVRDERRNRALRRASIKSQGSALGITVYTAAGRLITELPWSGGRIIGLGWTEGQRVVCVATDGTIHLMSLDQSTSQFSLGSEAADKGVLDVRIWPTGLVALLSDNSLIAVTSMDEPRPLSLAHPGVHMPPHDWQVIPPELSLSRQPEIHLAIGSTIIVVDGQDAQDQLLQQGPFPHIALSPNGKIVALYTVEHRVWVVSADYQKSLSECSVGPPESSGAKSSNPPSTPPAQLAWCGTDSVMLFRQGILCMVGPFGDMVQYSIPESLVLVPEIDGVRVIAETTCDFIQKVPLAAEEVFRIGSTSPAAMLYDALDHFDNGNPKAEEHIRAIRVDLPEAVDRCLEAAGHEWSSHYQQVLLRAASLGKSFLDAYSADAMVTMCQTLRVLNAIRAPEIGIALTLTQYKSIKVEGLLKCLTSRFLHLLALRICHFLRQSPDTVLVDWACAKIRTSRSPEETVCRQVVEKLSQSPGLSYAPVAETALALGHRRLASRLLEHEPKAADQVPLLLGMDEHSLALDRAIDSADADLVYHTLFYLQKKLPLAECLRMIEGKEMACRLLIHYARHQDHDLLKDYYFQADDRAGTGRLLVEEALEDVAQGDIKHGLDRLQQASKQFGKGHAFHSKCTDDQQKLLKLQEALQREGSGRFIGLSVPERRYWWTALRAHVAARDWEALEKLSNTKKPPIPMESFVDECLKAQHASEAKKYVVKCDLRARPGLYVRVGALKEAADAALALKDAAMLK
ncbi:MAG: Vps16, N-terminal region-domain-containing protein [Piptocephalis tieghemiana]|nr:MAG: Vps16, N-terminal region-domain-containing protein [Piptocephalis tieghemiana]